MWLLTATKQICDWLELFYVACSSFTRVGCACACAALSLRSHFQVSRKVKLTLDPLTTSSCHPSSVFKGSHAWSLFGEAVTTHEFRCKPHSTSGSGASCLTWYLLTPHPPYNDTRLPYGCSHRTSHHALKSTKCLHIRLYLSLWSYLKAQWLCSAPVN